MQGWLEQAARSDSARFFGKHRASARRAADRLPPSMAAHLLAGWESRLGITTPGNGSPVAVANRFIHDVSSDLAAARYRAAYDEGLIRDHANNYAALCSRMASMGKCRVFGLHLGIEPASGKGITPEGERARWNDPQWWRSQLRRRWTREAEDATRALGIIRKGAQVYVSDEAVKHRESRARRTGEWLAGHAMVSEDGEQLELLDLHKRSIANPAIRRTELMVRARGFDEFAESVGHQCDFYTLTAPSAFHAQRASGGVNPAWTAADRPRVQAAQQWLRKQWGRTRAKLARISVEVYGIRVAEPHHDGTPHWHLLLFGSPAALDLARIVLRGFWLSEYADEPGAREYRCKVERIDRAKGSAVGYIAKYISKNIDGEGAIGAAQSDETGEAVTASVSRVAAWATVHGIRQFQQYGGPPVGKWRELRRLRAEVAPEVIEEARAAADRNAWADYMRVADQVALVRETVRDGITTRPACSVNRYGERTRPRIVGLRDWHGQITTRPHRWRIVAKPAAQPAAGSDSGAVAAFLSGLGPVAITVRLDSEGSPPVDLVNAEVQRARDALAGEVAAAAHLATAEKPRPGAPGIEHAPPPTWGGHYLRESDARRAAFERLFPEKPDQ